MLGYIKVNDVVFGANFEIGNKKLRSPSSEVFYLGKSIYMDFFVGAGFVVIAGFLVAAGFAGLVVFSVI